MNWPHEPSFAVDSSQLRRAGALWSSLMVRHQSSPGMAQNASLTLKLVG